MCWKSFIKIREVAINQNFSRISAHISGRTDSQKYIYTVHKIFTLSKVSEEYGHHRKCERQIMKLTWRNDISVTDQMRHGSVLLSGHTARGRPRKTLFSTILRTTRKNLGNSSGSDRKKNVSLFIKIIKFWSLTIFLNK